MLKFRQLPLTCENMARVKYCSQVEWSQVSGLKTIYKMASGMHGILTLMSSVLLEAYVKRICRKDDD